MTARVSQIDALMHTIKDVVIESAVDDNISEMLLWLMVRQQADYELLLLEEGPADAGS